MLKIQIVFEDPLNVSPGNHRDILVIKLDLSGVDESTDAPIFL